MSIERKKGNVEIKELTEMALFIAIMCVLGFTPIGLIPIGIIKATTLHIPVIIAAIILGPKKGAITGAVFGCISFLNASFIAPTVTSFIFTPLMPGGNALSLVVCFVPRILIGVVAGYVYKGVKVMTKNNTVSILIAALAGSLTNTLLVMSMIYFFFGKDYAVARGVGYEKIVHVIYGIVVTNGIPEAVFGAFVSVGVCTALFLSRSKSAH